MSSRNNPKVNLKLRYKLVLRVGLVISLALLIVVLVAFPKFETGEIIEKEIQMVVETFDVPQTEQKFEQPPPPSRPTIPIESSDENFSEEVTIDETTFLDQYEAWEAPPPPPDEEKTTAVRFIAYEEPPQPIGGFAAIQRNVVYPEIAQEAGIEGIVIVRAFVNEYGKVTQCEILKGVPNTTLDDAAIAAVKKTLFKPAKQRDRNVGAWISIQVKFQLSY